MDYDRAILEYFGDWDHEEIWPLFEGHYTDEWTEWDEDWYPMAEYEVFHHEATWYEAQAHCEEWGGNLASV